jgi:hypothetical protein
MQFEKQSVVLTPDSSNLQVFQINSERTYFKSTTLMDDIYMVFLMQALKRGNNSRNLEIVFISFII